MDEQKSMQLDANLVIQKLQAKLSDALYSVCILEAQLESLQKQEQGQKKTEILES